MTLNEFMTELEKAYGKEYQNRDQFGIQMKDFSSAVLKDTFENIIASGQRSLPNLAICVKKCKETAAKLCGFSERRITPTLEWPLGFEDIKGGLEQMFSSELCDGWIKKLTYIGVRSDIDGDSCLDFKSPSRFVSDWLCGDKFIHGFREAALGAYPEVKFIRLFYTDTKFSKIFTGKHISQEDKDRVRQAYNDKLQLEHINLDEMPF